MKRIAARGLIAIAVLLPLPFFGCPIGDIAMLIREEPSTETGVLGDTDSSGDGDTGGNNDNAAPQYNAPVLKNTAIRYRAQENAPPQIEVTFSFDTAVTVTGQTPGGSVAKNGNTLTLSPSMTELTPGKEHPVSLTVATPQDAAKTLTVTETVIPVRAFFTRPETATEYTITEGTSYGAFCLRASDASTEWYYVEDDSARALMNAVYRPNAPDSTDAVESGKAALPYTETISQAVLGLFKITLGPDVSADRIEISGTEIPSPSGAGKYHPLVIDLGLPGGAANHAPRFRIPPGALGSEADYTHIRLRVNRDTKLVIEANNAHYTTWTDSPSEYGKLKNATVEVMGGGSLRDGAYKGSALGKDSLIIARLNSYLTLGPDEEYFVGPSQSGARILWDPGDQNGSFIEIRGDNMAFDTHLTVQKSLALAYNLWFVNGPRLTIAATDTLDGQKGLFPRDPDAGRKLYGTYYDRGGQNTAIIRASIIVNNGSAITDSLWTDTPGQTEGSRLLNYGKEPSVTEETYTSSATRISGYFNWR